MKQDRTQLRPLLAVVTIGIAMFAYSAALARPIFLAGPGATSCGQFASAYRESPTSVEQVFYSWAQGFMSSTNMMLSEKNSEYRDLGATTIDDQEAMIRAYCNAHPLASYADAVIDVLKSLPSVPTDGGHQTKPN